MKWQSSANCNCWLTWHCQMTTAGHVTHQRIVMLPSDCYGVYVYQVRCW